MLNECLCYHMEIPGHDGRPLCIRRQFNACEIADMPRTEVAFLLRHDRAQLRRHRELQLGYEFHR